MAVKGNTLQITHLAVGLFAAAYFATVPNDVVVHTFTDEPASISIESLYFYCGFHFVLPILLLFKARCKERLRLFAIQLMFATLSIIAIIIANEFSADTAANQRATNFLLQNVAGFTFNILKFVSYIFVYFLIAKTAFEKSQPTADRHG